MHHGLTNHNKIITNNLLTQTIHAKLMLELCNIRDLAFVLLRSKSFYVCLFSLEHDVSD